MKDYFGREIKIADMCAFEDNGHFDVRPIWGFEDDYVEIADYHKTLTKKAKEVIDITAIERDVREQQIFNSVKALDIKPNSTVVVSIIPSQISVSEAYEILDTLKAMYPNNEIQITVGLDVSVED